MKVVRIQDPVNCRVFREFLYAFQDNALAEPDHRRLQNHLDACPDCARLLEVEEGFGRALRARLRRAATPDGLDSRVREALRVEGGAGRDGGPGRRPSRKMWLAQVAAVLLLVVLVAPRLDDFRRQVRASAAAPFHRVERTVTVVDLDCERAGRSLDEQRRCRNARHLNALKVADGTYWNLSLDNPEARRLVVDPGQRGRRLHVVADYYPSLNTARLLEIHNLPPPQASL